MVLNEDIKDANIGLMREGAFGMQEQLPRQIEAIGMEQEVETRGEGFGGGFFPNDGLNGEEGVENVFMEGGPGEVLHEVDENALVELAGFVGHLVEHAVDGVELVVAREALEDGGVGGVVVVETLLL